MALLGLVAFGVRGFTAIPRQFNWCEPDEPVGLGINATYMEPLFCGLNSKKFTTHATIVEVPCDQIETVLASQWLAEMRKAGGDAWLSQAIIPDRMLEEHRHLYRQTQRFIKGTIVRRTDDGLDLEVAT